MCSGNGNDIPVRTVVKRVGDAWEAHCLDFDLKARAGETDDALDLLEQSIDDHLSRARKGEVNLFRPADRTAWDDYYQAATVKLLNPGLALGHVEHRPLLLETIQVIQI